MNLWSDEHNIIWGNLNNLTDRKAPLLTCHPGWRCFNYRHLYSRGRWVSKLLVTWASQLTNHWKVLGSISLYHVGRWWRFLLIQLHIIGLLVLLNYLSYVFFLSKALQMFLRHLPTPLSSISSRSKLHTIKTRTSDATRWIVNMKAFKINQNIHLISKI